MTPAKREGDSLVTCFEAVEAVETSSASCELGSWEGARFWKIMFIIIGGNYDIFEKTPQAIETQ